MKKSDVFPSRFLKPDDLNGKFVPLTIATAMYQTLKNFKGKDEQKLVLTFNETRKELVCNATIWDSVVDATGKDDSDDWPGCAVEAFGSEVQVGSEMKPCVRLRAAAQASLDVAAPAKKQPEKKQPEKSHDDMDDQIPFS
jgi:hypothetical protein